MLRPRLHASSHTSSRGPRRVTACASSRRLNLSSSGVVTGAPFAEGSFRLVAMGNYTNGPRKGEKLVAKKFKTGNVFESLFFKKDIKAVEKAQGIIDSYNEIAGLSISGKPAVIRLNHPTVWVYSEDSQCAGQHVLVEPFIEKYEKFNSNSGWADMNDGWPAVMQALSHYSYHCTEGGYVLCDLQGGVQDGGVVLTDPVILSRDKEFGVTDLGPAGISTFFSQHRCNRFCNNAWQRPRDRQAYVTVNMSTTMMM